MATVLEMPAGTGENAGGRALPMGPLAREIFSALDGAAIEWAVLRNAEGLPGHTRYDIDLLIQPGRMEEASRIVRRAAAGHGWTVLGRIDKRHYRCLLLVSPGKGEGRQFLPIDLFTALEWRANPFVDAAAGLRERRRINECVWVVSEGFAAATTVMKELMPHGRLKDNSRAAVRREAYADPDGFVATLWPVVGDLWAQRLLEICREGDWEALERSAPEVRRRVIGGLGRLARWPSFALKNLAHHLSPSVSAMVVFLGPDGSGKTTIAEGVARRMYKRPFKVCRYLHGRFEVLPEMKEFKRLAMRLVGRRYEPPARPEVGARHAGMHHPHPPLRGMMYATYYAIDLFLGRWKLRRMRAQWSLVIFDRYFDDYYFQRGYSRIPHWYLNALRVLVPRADVTVYLERDADDIYERKPELSVEEIRREQEVIRRIVAARNEAHVVDARAGVEATVQRVCDLIEARLGLGGTAGAEAAA